MAFGSILDGPNEAVLTQLVESALTSIIASLSDPQVSDNFSFKFEYIWFIFPTCCMMLKIQMYADILNIVKLLLNGIYGKKGY